MKSLYLTDAVQRGIVKERHATLRAMGRCLNGPLDGFVSQRGTVHGPVVRAGRCARCFAILESSR